MNGSRLKLCFECVTFTSISSVCCTGKWCVKPSAPIVFASTWSTQTAVWVAFAASVAMPAMRYRQIMGRSAWGRQRNVASYDLPLQPLRSRCRTKEEKISLHMSRLRLTLSLLSHRVPAMVHGCTISTLGMIHDLRRKLHSTAELYPHRRFRHPQLPYQWQGASCRALLTLASRKRTRDLHCRAHTLSSQKVPLRMGGRKPPHLCGGRIPRFCGCVTPWLCVRAIVLDFLYEPGWKNVLHRWLRFEPVFSLFVWAQLENVLHRLTKVRPRAVTFDVLEIAISSKRFVMPRKMVTLISRLRFR